MADLAPAAFDKDLETANLIDLLENARGNKVTRLP
jgi:hypothetical protein